MPITSNTKIGLNPVTVSPVKALTRQTGLGGQQQKIQQNKIRQSITAPTLGIGRGDNVMRFNSTDGLWIGNNLVGSAPFSVSIAGDLVATSATITGNIVSNSRIIINNSTAQQTSLTITDTITASGTIASINGNALLATGAVLQVQSTSLTTANLAQFNCTSSSTSTRNLVVINNNNSSATGATPLAISNSAVVSTNFKIMMKLFLYTVYTSNGTTPNGNLTGVQGDICLNGPSGQAFYCGGGTTWNGM